MTSSINRRAFVGAAVATGSLMVFGCNSSRREAADDPQSGEAANAAAPTAATRPAAMTVYRDPTCGCCEAWAKLARTAGYQVTLIDHSDMPSIKRQYGVPEQLASCHTAIVGGYAIEGHVPLADVERLLKDRPAGIKGIAVPGMPRGSPGMEMPDGARDQFEVIAFNADGKTAVFKA